MNTATLFPVRAPFESRQPIPGGLIAARRTAGGFTPHTLMSLLIS